jgi:peptidyl-prolyl cis-trans isomerase C
LPTVLQGGADERLDAPRHFGKRIVREPFLHFLLLGAALFASGHYLEERSRLTPITITKDQIRRIADGYRMQYGIPPSAAQLERLVDRFIEEEISYREALKLGLDREDEIIRRRLVQKYEFLQQDLSTPAEPTHSQLLDYYQKHLDRYRELERITFTHVYFSPERRGEEGAREAAEELASSLSLRGTTRAVDQGDRFPGPTDLTALSREELARVFGDGGLTQEVFGLELNRWSAPLRSGFGWHTVYVSERQPGRQAAFEDALQEIRRDYVEAERTRRNTETLAELREHFKIVRE